MKISQNEGRDRDRGSAGSGRLELVKSAFTRARSSDKRTGVPPGVRTRIMRIGASGRSMVTLLVVVLLATSMVAPIAAASTTSAPSSAETASITPPDHAGPPSGMVGVPSSNVGPPEHANAGGNGNGGGGPPEHAGPPMHAAEHIPSDAGVWQVHADKHAGDLETRRTTGRATLTASTTSMR